MTATVTGLLCQSCNLHPPTGDPIRFDDGVEFHICHTCRPIATGLRRASTTEAAQTTKVRTGTQEQRVLNVKHPASATTETGSHDKGRKVVLPRQPNQHEDPTRSTRTGPDINESTAWHPQTPRPALGVSRPHHERHAT